MIPPPRHPAGPIQLDTPRLKPPAPDRLLRVALLGNPNTGKTTLFNRLSGLRHKTSNFPGTTQDARLGFIKVPALSLPAATHPAPTPDLRTAELIDLPGIYSLELDLSESAVCRGVLAGTLAPAGERAIAPDAVCIVVDSTNLGRNLLLVGEALRRRLPTVVILNMIDLARRRGLALNIEALSERLGCRVVPVSARTGEGFDDIAPALAAATIPNRTPPGTVEGLEAWADEVYALAASAPATAANTAPTANSATAPTPPGAPVAISPSGAVGIRPRPAPNSRGRDAALTDRLDRIFTHPVSGLIAFTAIMLALFWVIFSLASYPMDWIESLFGALGGAVKAVIPPGILQDLLADGVVAGVGATVIFLPQICLLFFLISLLEDTGYLARAAFVMDRVLRPFGLPGHAFVPLLSSHACALPGIMSARAVPDRRDRLATILVAPFMSCSARIPVYVLLTGILFVDQPAMQALAFAGCYALGIAAGLFSALLARRTLLRGKSRAMALELPTYKTPSLRTALLTTYDRGLVFLKKAGTVILAISIILWWLSAYPHAKPTPEAESLRAQAALLETAPTPTPTPTPTPNQPDQPATLRAQADRLDAAAAAEFSFAGRIGRTVQPIFEPLGYDWRLTIGVVTSFAAREVFVSTMSVVLAGEAEAQDEAGETRILERLQTAQRDNGALVFSHAASWSLLVFYVLAMQCLPTLAVTAREAGGWKWAALQFTWMTTLAWLGGFLAFTLAS